MRVGWLVDQAAVPGGAELTQAEFRDAAPDTITIVDCLPGHIEPCDRYVVQNCVQYDADDILAMQGKPVVKYWHDVGPHLQDGVMDALNKVGATHICCSPVQADYMGLNAQLIPPPVDLARFEAAAQNVNGNRAGAVCVGSWRNYGKAAHRVAEWGAMNGGVTFYGSGPFAPNGSVEVPYDRMPDLLAHYKTFVFLPMVLEPFGRTVAEAWAAGCEIVTNGLVGARYWLEGRSEAIETAAEDFWEAVLS